MNDTSGRWLDAGTTHSRVLASCEDRSERMRMLASAPMFSLWREIKVELEEAADEIQRLRQRIRELEDDGA